jgi:hypothetical protein
MRQYPSYHIRAKKTRFHEAETPFGRFLACILAPKGPGRLQNYGKDVKFGKSVTFDTSRGTYIQFQDISFFMDEDKMAYRTYAISKALALITPPPPP